MALYGHELTIDISPYEAGLGKVVRLNKEFVGRDALQSLSEAPVNRFLVGLRGEGKRAARAELSTLAKLGPTFSRQTEVADLLHLHVNTVKRLGDRGEIPFYRVCKRGDRRFRLDDVMKFLSTNR